ncbi:PREDICTED: regulator of G-protein signaling protein-like, partial [Leptosomus discolor]|uniref:regulator of G-protein signaling protein-like n=1 Tax=Leptosomus discolor TaxID=188344 RepID=UPI0005224D19
IIASTDMGLLLRDDVFVNFFNTFLNLPVFGQTPIYISSTGRWEFWPELTSYLDPSPPALLAWLEKPRLPHFCKSSLCLNLVLCQKLLGFIRSGEAGEELTSFWLTTERLLGLDESDARQRDLYLSLLHRLKATHLREGSTIVTLCRTIVGSLPKARHVQPISTRREILRKMQERALCMIQSYWLPKFFIHCKMSMAKEKSCWPLLKEYQERLLWANSQEPSGFSENLFMMHVKKSQGLSGPYCSRKAKAEIWTLVKEGRNTQELKMPSFQVQPERQPGPAGSTKESRLDKDALGLIPQQSEHPANAAFGDKGGATSTKRPRPNAEQVHHLKDLCEEKVLSNLCSSAPLVQLPSLKKPVETLSFLPWALSAETCAGQPFRDFLKCQNRPMETLVLDLWHDLEEFLPVVLDPSRENSFFLRHLIGEKICKTYLEEGTVLQLPLETRTLRSLQNHLMSGEFSPWIFRAQKEICKVLCSFYEEFLADDDRTFFQFMSPQSDVLMPEMQGHAVGKDECFLLSQRINESLKLAQALHGRRNLEGLSSEHWRLVATRDLRKGGSIQTEVEILLCRTGHWWYRDHISWCLFVYRHFVKVLHDPAHLQFFKQFLEERNADKPLRFWIAVEKLVTETNPKRKSFLINSIVRNYFCAEIPAEEQLHCDASIIKEINDAKAVSPFMLITAQIFVQKAMEKRRFKEYQDLFPPTDMPKSNLHLQHRMRNFRSDKLRWAWHAIRDLVKSLCKFRREMDNDKCRAEFEVFLHQELGNEEENLPISLMKSSSTVSNFHPDTASASTPPDKEMVLVKRHLFNSQLVTVNFLVNDLRFYLEIDKFSRLADSVEALAARNMQSEKEVAFLKRKVAIISKLFLNSDIPPKLRVLYLEGDEELSGLHKGRGANLFAQYENLLRIT